MSGLAPGTGRQDRAQHPLMSYRTRANITIWVTGLWMVGSWHLVVVWLTPVTLAQIERTARGTATGKLPGNPSWAVLFGLWLLIFLAGVGIYTYVSVKFSMRRQSRAGKGMADRAEVKAALGVDAARKQAQWSRPSLAEKGAWKKAPASEVGFVVGSEKATKQEVVLPNNAFLAVLGPTGAQKTNSIVVPRCLEAPGALIVTTNETGLLDLIATARSKKGKIWVFDPDDRAGWYEEMTWDPTAGAEDPKRALARAGAFADGCLVNSDTKNGGFFKGQATAALRACFHAAALKPGGSIDDVLRWTLHLENTYEAPANLITGSSEPDTAALWADRLQDVATGADETVASTRNTLNQTIDPLLLPSVMRWVRRRDGVPQFDPDEFIRSTDTLVLISDASSSTNVGPLTAMLYQEVMDAVKRAAPFLPGRTLDPPLSVVGDEIANVAPIEKLPEMCTEVRKLGVHKIVIFQGLIQATIRWGPERGELLLQQQAGELVLPGLKDVKGLDRYSDLAGMTDVLEGSVSLDRSGVATSSGMDVRERKILRNEEIRKLEDGEGLLLWRNASPMKIRLRPWYERPDADQIRADSLAVQQRRIAHQEHRKTAPKEAAS